MSTPDDQDLAFPENSSARPSDEIKRLRYRILKACKLGNRPAVCHDMLKLSVRVLDTEAVGIPIVAGSSCSRGQKRQPTSICRQNRHIRFVDFRRLISPEGFRMLGEPL